MTRRRQDIELLRVISAFGIVWFHAAADGMAVAYSGLVVFVVLSVFLGGSPAVPDGPSLRRRATRLLLPWLLWSVVYATVNVWRGAAAWPAGPNSVARVLAGPSIHLWYLPFIFLCLGGIDVLKAHVTGPRLARGSGLAALACVATAPWWRPVSLALPYPLLQWADAAAPLAFGLFLRTAPRLPRRQARGVTLLVVAAAFGVAGFNNIGVSYAIAFLLCWLVASGGTAVLFRFPMAPVGRVVRVLRVLPVLRLAPVADATFGVYLLHPLVFLALLSNTTLAGNALPVPIFCISLAVVMVLRRAAPRLARFWC